MSGHSNLPPEQMTARHMSGHADTIREVFSLLPKAAVEIDSLLDENQRLRDFIQAVADCEYYSAALRENACEALAGDTECVCGEINTRHCPVHGQGDTE